MRPLIIDDAARATAARVVSYAMDHPFRLGDPAPGDNPNFVAHFDSYRAVFTFTHDKGTVYRHLTVSVPSSKFPHPAVMFTIATLLGFTGWDERTLDRLPDGWIGDVRDEEHCIMLAQQVN